VVLTGNPEAAEDRELILVAIRLIWDVGGAIDVENRLGWHAAAGSGEPGLLLSVEEAGEQDGEPGATSPPKAAAPPEPGGASKAAFPEGSDASAAAEG
jgi:hypothetical protein